MNQVLAIAIAIGAFSLLGWAINKGKQYPYRSILLLILPALLAGSAAAQDHRQTAEDFERYRGRTLEILKSDLERNPKCELRRAVATVEQLLIFVQDGDKRIRAWAFPKFTEYTETQRPLMFVNGQAKWNERRAVVAILHEAFAHLTAVDGRFICGKDRVRSSKPICSILGRNVFHSVDIDDAIKNHLRKYLKRKEGR
jgi:hypothetical protein